jgi:hypothetical protein
MNLSCLDVRGARIGVVGQSILSSLAGCWPCSRSIAGILRPLRDEHEMGVPKERVKKFNSRHEGLC